MTDKPVTQPWSQPVDTLPDFAHFYATVDGLRLHYVRGGNPHGEVLLLLAGFFRKVGMPGAR